jgi:hypothetical protein
VQESKFSSHLKLISKRLIQGGLKYLQRKLLGNRVEHGGANNESMRTKANISVFAVTIRSKKPKPRARACS